MFVAPTGSKKRSTYYLASLVKHYLYDTNSPKAHGFQCLFLCQSILHLVMRKTVNLTPSTGKFIDQCKLKTSTKGTVSCLLISIHVQASMLHVKSCPLFLNVNFTPRFKHVNKKPIHKSSLAFKDHTRPTRHIACSSLNTSFIGRSNYRDLLKMSGRRENAVRRACN